MSEMMEPIYEYIVAYGDIASRFEDEVRLDKYIFPDIAEHRLFDFLTGLISSSVVLLYARNSRFATSLLFPILARGRFAAVPQAFFTIPSLSFPRADIFDRLVFNGKIFKNTHPAFALRRLSNKSDFDRIAHRQVEIARHVKMFAV